MKTKVLMVGYCGSMGRRYSSILDYLEVPWTGLEINDNPYSKKCIGHSHVLICSPTELHLKHIATFAYLGVPILCEKPISLNFEILKLKMEVARKNGIILDVVNQYRYLADPTTSGLTHYNYYNSGRDGLKWDCISLIALAKGPIELKNTSPIWSASINGKPLDKNDMDQAYINMMKEWLQKPKENYDYILESHRKVEEFK